MQRQDQFLNMRPSQPKAATGRYVEKNGILVPAIYDGFSDAVKFGKNVIARSENWREYAGIAGHLDSPMLSEYKDAKSSEDLKRILREEISARKYDLARIYCDYMNIDLDKFWNETSFSFWEKMEGYNLTITADSSVNSRHHVMVHEPKKYYLIDAGDARILGGGSGDSEALDVWNNLKEITEFYDKIRNLGMFDPNHCPIIEAQLVGDKIYFLQYHRGRDFEESAFRLERDPEDPEVVASFVRGATGKDGVTYEKIGRYTRSENVKQAIPKNADVAIGKPIIAFASELMARETPVRLMSYQTASKNLGSSEDLMGVVLQELNSHNGISNLYKPGMSIITDPLFDSFGALDPVRGIRDHFPNIRIISDGRKAFLKLIEPEHPG